MSEIKNIRFGLCGAERSKCNHLMTLRFKGLKDERSRSWVNIASTRQMY